VAAAEIGLSIAAVGRRDYIAAEAALRRVLKQDPGHTTACLQLARVLVLTGRRQEGMRFAETARRLGASDEVVQAAAQGMAFA
jgi:Tfp pilus assembly protein PilF